MTIISTKTLFLHPQFCINEFYEWIDLLFQTFPHAMISDDQCHAKKQMLCPSLSSNTIVGKLPHDDTNDPRNISTSTNCIISKSTNGRIEENSNSLTTLVLPIRSPEVTSSTMRNEINNPIESKSEYKE